MCIRDSISVHAPTEASPEMEKEEFYELIDETFDQWPSYDIKVIVGAVSYTHLDVYKRQVFYLTHFIIKLKTNKNMTNQI